MDKQHTVLWMPSWYPSEANPYFARFTQRHAEADSTFNKVIVLYTVFIERGEKRVEVIERNPNMTEIIRYEKAPSFKFNKIVKLIFSTFIGFRYVLKNYNKPSIIHLSVIYPVGICVWLINFLYKIPYVLDEHWTGYRKKNGAFKGGFKKLIAFTVSRNASAILAISNSMADSMLDCGLVNKYYVVPNVVDEIETTQVNPGLFCQFIHASSFEENHKNISGILRAIKILSTRTNEPFKMLMVGGDASKITFYKKMANRLSISKFVEFTGFKQRDSLRQLMFASDAFVMFSHYEGLPCVILESMSVGTPVICTETGGMKEWIHTDTGILIDREDEIGLANAMLKIIQGDKQYNRDLLESIIREKCSYRVVGKQYKEIYSELLKN